MIVKSETEFAVPALTVTAVATYFAIKFNVLVSVALRLYAVDAVASGIRVVLSDS